MNLGALIQIVVLPYIDLVLMACNASSGILTCMILSVKYLDETWTWKYDFTAMIFFIVGSVAIILTAHTEEVSFTVDEVAENLKSFRTLAWLAF